ncbi:hypothetical protein [Spirillospora sp. NPDC029432]|uniref:hypothetical protein n=1 Tax=Spirillospora sp. NPDC029432 TaxID=3154599 RepID=UPI003453D251
MPEGVPATALPRRALLGAGAALGLPLVGGCGGAGRDAGTAAARAELTVLVGAIAAEQDLIALYEAVRGAHAPLAARIDPALAHHREHLAVLKRHYRPGSGDRADEAAIPAPRAQRAPAGRARALAALRQAEERAAAARAAEAGKVEPGLAQLLASIGACEAGHAAALEGA